MSGQTDLEVEWRERRSITCSGRVVGGNLDHTRHVDDRGQQERLPQSLPPPMDVQSAVHDKPWLHLPAPRLRPVYVEVHALRFRLGVVDPPVVARNGLVGRRPEDGPAHQKYPRAAGACNGVRPGALVLNAATGPGNGSTGLRSSLSYSFDIHCGTLLQWMSQRMLDPCPPVVSFMACAQRRRAMGTIITTPTMASDGTFRWDGWRRWRGGGAGAEVADALRPSCRESRRRTCRCCRCARSASGTRRGTSPPARSAPQSTAARPWSTSA